MADIIRPSDEEVKENIKKWNIPLPQQDYMVVVQCSTYNHEAYIEDALKGFVMQETNFPFCALVTDDCSTDGTAKIIKRYAENYPNIIIPILLGENHMQHKISRNPYIDPWHNRAKYIAICEGDDYWTDPLKLQKQVDYLESHPEVGLVHTDYSFVNINSKMVDGGTMSEEYKTHVKNGFVWHKYLEGAGFILTCTVLFRKSLDLNERCFLDHGQYMMLQRQKKIYQIPDNTASYRINPKSMMQSQRAYVSKLASRAIFYQLYYYSIDRVHTNKYYYWNPCVLFTITKSIVINGRELKVLDLEDGKRMYKTIVIRNLLTLILFLPVVIPSMAFSKVMRCFK